MPWSWVILGSVALVVAGEVGYRAWAFKRTLKVQEKTLDAVLEGVRDRKAARNLRSGIDPFDRRSE